MVLAEAGEQLVALTRALSMPRILSDTHPRRQRRVRPRIERATPGRFRFKSGNQSVDTPVEETGGGPISRAEGDGSLARLVHRLNRWGRSMIRHLPEQPYLSDHPWSHRHDPGRPRG